MASNGLYHEAMLLRDEPRLQAILPKGAILCGEKPVRVVLAEDFDAMRERAEKVERAAMLAAQLLAEVTSSDGSGHADLSARILSAAGVSRDEAGKLIEGWKAKSQWRIDAALAQQA